MEWAATERAHGSSPRARGTGAIPRPTRPSRPVHPRGRGERSQASASSSHSSGSSPRARGTATGSWRRNHAQPVHPRGRGERQFRTWRNRRLPVHPRGRGERTMRRTVGNLSRGSSPRARGTGRRPAHVRRRTIDRFIPAGAGNGGGVDSAMRALLSVHPRGRGERVAYDTTVLPIVRFIPAGAGNGAALPETDHEHSVHPRGRGERFNRRCVTVRSSGSSPRARGTVDAT